jgi:hypothetical protein
MKNTTFFITTILLIFSAIAHAQPKQIQPKTGDNIKNASLNKFEGIYVWSHGADTLMIILKKENVELVKGIKSDVLIGFHKYVKNGRIVESSYDYHKSNHTDKRSTILISNRNESDTLDGVLKDLTKKKSVGIELVYSPARKSITMTLAEREGIRINKNQDVGFTLPQPLVLIKR